MAVILHVAVIVTENAEAFAVGMEHPHGAPPASPCQDPAASTTRELLFKTGDRLAP